MSTKALVEDYVKSEKQTRLAFLNTVYPDLAVLMVATLGQTLNPSLETAILEPKFTTSSKASRKSLTDPLAETVPMTNNPGILGGDEFYLRPNGDKYFPRPWGGTAHDDIGVLRKARDTNKYLLLYGAPGCGKTAMTEAAFGEDLYVILGTGDTEVSDFIGGYTQGPDGSFIWVDGVLVRAMEEGKMLLIDEIGLVDTKVLSVVYSAMDGRRELYVSANPDRGLVKAVPGFGVVGATNPHAPGVRLSEALLSRFSIHVEVTTDWDLAKTLGVPRDMVSIAKNANLKVTKQEMTWAPQFRELLEYRDLSAIFGIEFAQANIMASCPEIERGAFRALMSVAAHAGSTTPMPARI